MKNPYKVVMQQSKLPLSLLNDRKATNRVHLLDTESFENTFGKLSLEVTMFVKGRNICQVKGVSYNVW